MEEGFRREEPPSDADIWLDGRQLVEEVRQNGLVEGHGCPLRQGDSACRHDLRCLQQPLPRARASVERGDVLAGRVEQGVVKPGEDVVFLPTHTASNQCAGKVFSIEMHHPRCDAANPGDNVGLNIKGLDKANMPRSGDVMVYKKDTTLGQTKEFDAQIQVLDIPNEIKVGYSPIGFVRCGRSACRISKISWKMGKETGGKKMEDPHSQ